MDTIKQAMESYVNFMQGFADPFGVGMSVHLAIFSVNRIVLYILLRGLTKKSENRFWKIVHEFSGILSFVLGYLITVGFIWIKNN